MPTESKPKPKPQGEEALYHGTVRVVTEADILAEPRLVGAGAVVGQLYDFSNLPHVKDGGAERNAEELNKAHDEAEENRIRKEDRAAELKTSGLTTEAEREAMGMLTPEEQKEADKRDEEARERIEEKRREDEAAAKKAAGKTK